MTSMGSPEEPAGVPRPRKVELHIREKICVLDELGSGVSYGGVGFELKVRESRM